MSEEAGGEVRGHNRFPSPGSLTALKKGCICPPQVNAMGRGNVELNEKQPGQRWIYSRECPYHVIPMGCATVTIEEHSEWVVLEQPGDDEDG